MTKKFESCLNNEDMKKKKMINILEIIEKSKSNDDDNKDLIHDPELKRLVNEIKQDKLDTLYNPDFFNDVDLFDFVGLMAFILEHFNQMLKEKIETDKISLILSVNDDEFMESYFTKKEIEDFNKDIPAAYIINYELYEFKKFLLKLYEDELTDEDKANINLNGNGFNIDSW